MLGDADTHYRLVRRKIESAFHRVEVDPAVDRKLLGLRCLAGIARIPGRVGEPEGGAPRAVRKHLRRNEIVRGPEFLAVPHARAARAARAADAVEVEAFAFLVLVE